MFEAPSFSKTFYRTCLRGYERMSPEATEALRLAVAENQGPGGMFRDRSGREDLYYTFFGVLLAAVTGTTFRRKECRKAMESQGFATLDVVHGCAWLRIRNMLKFLAIPTFLKKNVTKWHRFPNDRIALEKLRDLENLPASAYPQRDKDAPYSRFLLETLHLDFARKPTLPAPSSLDEYRLPNGLYANLKNHPDYGVNATAAALFLLHKEECAETADALAALQEPDGSFKANASAREGDLLSTATALFALQYCNKIHRVSVRPYLRACFRDDGLFAATPDDERGDLEYTTYGLLAMGGTA